MYVKKFLQFNTNRLLRRNTTARSTTDFKKATRIGIIFSAEGIEKHNAIKKLIKDLKNDGKKVTVLSYLGKGKQNHEFLFEIISSNDVSFFGSLRNDIAIKFAEEEFDYLLNLDTSGNHIIENILAMSKAKCRVGIYREDTNPFYELMISPKNPDSTEDLIQDIYRYTKNITINGT